MTLEELAAKLGAEFQGQADLKLTCSCGLDSLQKGGLAYVTGSGGIGNVPVPAELDRSLRKAPEENVGKETALIVPCLLYTSPSPRDRTRSRMPSSA